MVFCNQMQTVILLAVILAVLVYLGMIVGAKMMHCRNCKKRVVARVEATKYWRKYECRRCGHTFVEETGF